MILAQGPTVRHVYEWAQNFLQNDPDFQGIANDFTPDMFSVQVIEVLGTPSDKDSYTKDFVSQNCVNIVRNVENLEPITDVFVFFQLVTYCMNTYTQYMITNVTIPPQDQLISVHHVHVETVIANAILKKGTPGSFHQCIKDDYDLTVTVIQKSSHLR
jgi:hypothetical protein